MRKKTTMTITEETPPETCSENEVAHGHKSIAFQYNYSNDEQTSWAHWEYAIEAQVQEVLEEWREALANSDSAPRNSFSIGRTKISLNVLWDEIK